MQTPTDLNTDSTVTMDSDFHNNNLANKDAGKKRRMVDDNQQAISQEKIAKKGEMLSPASTTNCGLKLDVYTQTESSFLTSNKSLSRVGELVQANNDKLERIEKFLETLGSKIEGFLMADEADNELSIAKKKEANSSSVKHTSGSDSGWPVTTVSVRRLEKVTESPRDINFPADSTKSPSLCSSPEGSSSASSTENQHLANNSVSLNPGSQRRCRATGRPIPSKFMTSSSTGESTTRGFVTEEQSETSSRGLEKDLKGVGDTDAIVPVIISMGDNSKRSVTIEVPLEDIVKGASCTLEGLQHLCYSQGFWFGNKNNPLSRVWFCGENKLLGRSEASGTNPAKLSLNLLEALFTRDEMAASNINGARGRELLDPIKIKAIQAHINFKFPIEPEKEEIRWRFIKPRIDSKCRAQRRLQREQLARLESLSQTGTPGRVVRSRYPRVDPREKEELLYGNSRSTEFVLSTPRPQAVECSFQETEAKLEDGQSSETIPVVELPANEAIVKVSGTSVTVEGASSSEK